MKRFAHILSGIAGLVLALSPAQAGPSPAPVGPPERAVPVSGNCNSIAQKVGQQYGGRARGTLQNRGGQQVCVVVVVVEGKAGERSQRIEVVVPAG